MPGNENSRLVYSTDSGRVKPAPPATPRRAGPQPRSEPPADGVVRVSRDKKGRGGKTATLITGLPGNDAELDALLKRFKSSLGSGGTREGRTLVIQGDHRERLMTELTSLGHRPKLAGG